MTLETVDAEPEAPRTEVREYEGGTRDALLFLVGCSGLVQALSDGHLRYVKASFQPWLAVAGGLLVLLALVGFVRGTRPEPAGTPDAGPPPEATGATGATAATGAHSDHGHSHGGIPRVAWLLLLPVVVLAFVSPPPLGSYSAARAGNRVVAPEDGYRYPELVKGSDGVAPLTLMDYSQRVLFDEGRSLEGETVRLTGFVTPAEQPGGFFLTRIMLSCCAADGRPVKVFVTTDQPVPAADTWLDVTGRWPGAGAPVVTQSQRVAPLEAATLTRIATPENTYA